MTITLERPTIKPIRVNPKRSIRAKKVAQEVIQKLRNNEDINMQVIQKKHGYSVYSANNMSATKTRSYQEEIQPVLDKMSSLRDKVVNALHRKDLDEAKVFDLNLLLKNLNHDLQLLNGKSTANHSHVNKVIVYGSDDFLALQMSSDKK